MNQKLHITILVLGMITLMSGTSFAYNRTADSLLITRIWDYKQKYGKSVEGVSRNVYMVYQFGTKRRNPLLFLIPTMYSIAKGQRQYIGEAYSKLEYRNNSDYQLQRQVVCGTIPHNRNVMPIMLELMTPDVYGAELYPNKILSPFYRTNRFFYKYSVQYFLGNTAIVFFRPRSANTLLVKGKAIVDINTGYIHSLTFSGEFDMVRFNLDVTMSSQDSHATLPERSTASSTFKFIGNNIQASCTSYFNCSQTLPDSIDDVEDRELMATLRPEALTPEHKMIYEQQDLLDADSTSSDTIPDKKNHLRDFFWNVIGDNMVNSINARSGAFDFHVSPLFNPLYMSYSNSKGISYRLSMDIRYMWNSHRYLTFSPQIGYNTTKDQFYYTLPLRMTYNPKRNGYAEIRFGNGERISNDILNEAFRDKLGGDTISMPEFKDKYLQVVNHVAAFDWLEFTTGLVYHQRRSMDRSLMEKAGLPSEYRSFAPTLSAHFTPWTKGPTLTANYERSFKNIFQSDLEYERWEFDAVYKYELDAIRLFNLRFGSGFYTMRSSDYFVDYSNFRDNNLPTGWEDDWSGQFQLIPSAWYNQSDYYIRAHTSYDSPLLALSWVPWVGRLIENERIYISMMSIQHTRPYFEIGYGFKNRYFSTAVFGSFLNTEFQKVGFKFTIELFRRW